MTEQAKIEEVEVTIKGGFIPWHKEKYPFSKLTPSSWTDETETALKGPSFLISKDDNPPSVLAAGRKRFKHCKFVSKKMDKDGNVRVWLHPDSALPTDKPVSGGVTKPAAKPAAKKAAPAAKPAAATGDATTA